MTAAHARPTASGVDPAALKAAAERRLGLRVERHETHGSIVFVGGNRAFKLRKPVAFDFADLRDPAVRRELALADAELNTPLAPGLVCGVLDVVAGMAPGSVDLVPAGAPDALDVVVELRRYDERCTMRALLDTGDVTTADCQSVGRAVADFHQRAERARNAAPTRVMVDRNLEAVLPLLGPLLPARARFALQRTLDAFLFAWEPTLSARAAGGLVIDGHGDLRAEHVVIESGRVRVVDRLEFADLRAVDVADELAFLLMELVETTGTHDLGEAVLDGYREAGGIVPPHALLAFFGVHRALVRAKVALQRAGQVTGVAADDATARAFHLVSVAQRLAWRARGRSILLVTGPPASGKSTLAAALAEAGRLPVLSSDAVRQTGTTKRDYSLEGRTGVYARLGTQAGEHDVCVVDATFADEAFQHAFLSALPRERRADLLVIACHLPLAERVERARRRSAEGSSASEAGPDVVRALATVDDERAMLPFTPRLAVDTHVPLAAQVDLVESWLDARLAASGE
jgi:uncharacterized protein